MSGILKNKVYRIIVATDLLQQLAIWIRNMALLFFIMEATKNDPVAVALIYVLEFLPILMFSVIGGTLADRWNPKKTMITGDFLSSFSIVIIIVLVSLGYWQALFLAAFVSAILSQFSAPSSIIMFKKHLPEEQIAPSIATIQTLSFVYIIVGPVLGTLVYTALGITASLIGVAILFMGSALVQFALPSSERPPISNQASIINELKEGFGFVKNNQNLVIIASTLAVIGISQGAVLTLGPYVVMERLGLQKENVQWLYSLMGIGFMVGGVTAGLVAERFRGRNIMFVAVCVLCSAMIVEVLSVRLVLTGAMRLVEGIALAFLNIVLNTLIIKLIKEEYVGRITGIITTLLIGGIIIGSSLAGISMKVISLIPTYFVAAGILFLGALSILRLKVD